MRSCFQQHTDTNTHLIASISCFDNKTVKNLMKAKQPAKEENETQLTIKQSALLLKNQTN